MTATICRMSEKTYSTLQAAKKSGVHRATLIRWIQAGRVKASKEIQMPGGNVLRWWSDADIERLKMFKDDHYWGKNRGKRSAGKK